MQRQAKVLLLKSLDSLLLSIEYFNRPWNRGRKEAVLILLDRAFELFLKAAIVHRRGKIREPRSKETIGLDKCVRKCLSEQDVKCLTDNQALTIQIINSLRDAAQHYILEISEQELYTYTQAGVTLYASILKLVFKQSLSKFLPERVFPITSSPPQSFHAVVDNEFALVRKLVTPGSRKLLQARAKLRSLAIVDASLAGIRSQPAESELKRLVERVRDGEEWKDIFPGIATLELNPDSRGLEISVRLTKSKGEAVNLVPEGTPGATIVAVKRVNELDYYSLGLADLAKKLNLTQPKAVALVRYAKLQESSDYYKEIAIGKARYKRYSGKALDQLRNLAAETNLDEVWRTYKTKPAR